MINERDNLLLEMLSEYDIPQCSVCKSPMIEGYCIENGIDYYCTEQCLHREISEYVYLSLFDDGNGDSYWTSWQHNESDFKKVMDLYLDIKK